MNLPKLPGSQLERTLSVLAIIYFMIGVVFATCYALFYHWSFFSFLSPGFYAVLLSWPIQLPGLLTDFQLYGWAGKVIQ
jgi:hypothetical protein